MRTTQRFQSQLLPRRSYKPLRISFRTSPRILLPVLKTKTPKWVQPARITAFPE